MAKTAVVLFNLGGPDRLQAVRPFLFNLFNDPAIIALPAPLRWLIARLISSRRAPVAQEIYARLGGGSPLLRNTMAQAQALGAALNDEGHNYRVFIAMRYWEPFSREAAAAVKAYGPDRIVLLPLYPQFSTTTTGSSLADWKRAAAAAGLKNPTFAVCCYPTAPGFVASVANRVAAALDMLREEGLTAPRVLFSAHGLPKRIVEAGDPYQWQVERSVAAVVARLNVPGLEHVICYQSRVGPMKWIGPSTDDEIRRCGHLKRPCIVVPIAFVSEHSETLVELDVEYRKHADLAGVPRYIRAPAVSTDAVFIEALAELVRAAETEGVGIVRGAGEISCPERQLRCPHRQRVA